MYMIQYGDYCGNEDTDDSLSLLVDYNTEDCLDVTSVLFLMMLLPIKTSLLRL